MIELPEASVLAQQMMETLGGKRIIQVITQRSPHKFAWFFGNPQEYNQILSDCTIENVINHAGLVEIYGGKANLVFGDGVNLRYFAYGEKIPDKHQLDLEFEDGSHLIASVQMYGGLWAFHEGENKNPYYLITKEKPSPISADFTENYFDELIGKSKESLSLKAFLATEQRIPGLGNGVLQDILFVAGLHPKYKIKNLMDEQKEVLYHSIRNTLEKMIAAGGRDTERDLFGNLGGYQTILSKNTVNQPCSVCGTVIKKEAYMGGSVYICEGCQKG